MRIRTERFPFATTSRVTGGGVVGRCFARKGQAAESEAAFAESIAEAEKAKLHFVSLLLRRDRIRARAQLHAAAPPGPEDVSGLTAVLGKLRLGLESYHQVLGDDLFDAARSAMAADTEVA